MGYLTFAFNAIDDLIIFPVHPRSKKALANIGLPVQPNVKLIDPIGYFEMIALERSARMILTDSGGVQKEAYWLGVPCVTLRDETEWVETVEAGWNVLAGADSARIINLAATFRPAGARPLYFGDGHAAEQIVAIIQDFLAAGAGKSR